MPGPIHVASVVLNYNSSQDLAVLLPQLKAQRGIVHVVVVVDNASRAEEVERAKDVFSRTWPDGVAGATTDITANTDRTAAPASAYLVIHDRNGGYSAGNNVGIRLAEGFGAAAVLIANPDMRLDNPDYVAQLYETLMQEPDTVVAASRVVGLDGRDQSPLTELAYWEELLWPAVVLRNMVGRPISHVAVPAGEQAVAVQKVSGCCLMLRTSFLRDNGYLDEGVFLYCEEPILSEQVRRVRGRIVFQPRLKAVHAHQKKSKGNPSRNMLWHIESRQYFIRHYANRGQIAKFALSVSYALLKLAHRIRLRLRP
jgi:GT2 family glycosyltransferase